jgi:hypothetical protein
MSASQWSNAVRSTKYQGVLDTVAVRHYRSTYDDIYTHQYL